MEVLLVGQCLRHLEGFLRGCFVGRVQPTMVQAGVGRECPTGADLLLLLKAFRIENSLSQGALLSLSGDTLTYSATKGLDGINIFILGCHELSCRAVLL